MRLTRPLAALGAAALVASGLTVAGPAQLAAAESAPVDPSVDATVTADALPTVQIDGVVWAQVVVGTTVYVGGEFTTARPAGAAPGVSTVPRENLLAYDITTGELLPWAPTANGAVYALAASPDGGRIYVGGNFSRLSGSSRNRFGAVSARDGGTLSTFTAGSNGQVRGIAVTNSSVFIAGAFNTVGGQSRPRIAAFDSRTGELRSFRADVQSRQVDAIAASPDGQRVYITGRFEKVGATERLGAAAFDANTAALLPWTLGRDVYNHGSDASINHVQVDEKQVYATAFTYFISGTGVGNVEGPFAADPITGKINWIGDCHGDTYGIYLNPGEDHFYVAGHPHMCNNIGAFPEPSRRVHYFGTAFTKDRASVVTPNTQSGGYANNEGFGAPAIRNFFPQFTEGTYTGTAQATWSVTGAGDYVAFGGEFVRVNGVPQQGLVRFAKRALAPGEQGPQLSGTPITPTARSHARGTVQVSWPTNHDRDNEWLTYTVLRGPSNNLQEVYSVTASSRFWNRPRLSFTDTGLANSTSYSYRVRVTDATGNSVTSSAVSVTTAGASTAPLSEYARTILDDNPNNYWRLGETSNVMRDWTSYSDATVGTSVQRNQPGAIVGDPDRAAYFSGTTNNARIYSNNQEYGQDRLSVEAWFRTSSSTGGKIVGFGQTRGTGNSSNYDRHLYMTPEGRIVWGVYPNGVRTISSTRSFNDDKWHHVVGTLGPAGMRLYVDGAEVAANPDVIAGQASLNGYWRIGGDNMSGWPGTGSDNFTGLIDEVATYGRQLSLADVVRHYGMGTGGEIPNIPPTASFTATGGVLTASFDASASADADGKIASYAWDFGDGRNGTGRTVTHSYATAGTFQVTLTVTDDDGATASTTQEVTVEAPNRAPTAAFTWSSTHLTASVDAGGSSDPDGSIVSYQWRWGDGSTSTGATAQHTYDEAGTYPVRLTVTDDDGATGTVTIDVTVTDPPAAPDVIARDAFSRTVSSDWGTADVGGAWITTSGAGSVAQGTGRLALGSAGAIAGARLPGAEGTHVTTSTTVRWDKRPSGSGGYTLLRGRIAAGGEYRFKVNFRSNGQLQGWIARASSTGSETVIAPALTVTGATYGAGTPVALKMEVSGASPTTIRAKLWTGDAEPTAWQWEVTDATAGLQVPGHTGVAGILAPNTTNTPVVVSFDDYRVEVPAGSGPAPNESPEAAFTSEPGVLKVAVDGSASSDPDGEIVSYAWSWGDGSSSTTTSAATEHEYSEAGTYTVTLTVTDDRGGTATAQREVQVRGPNAKPVARFVVTTSGRQVSVDASTSSDPDGSIASYSWSWGDGSAAGSGKTASHTYTEDGAFDITLTVTDDEGATSSVTHRVEVEVEAPAPGGALARDGFARSVASGWGTADLGGAWLTSGAASVSGGAGQLVLGSAGALVSGRLPGAVGEDLVTSLSLAWDKRPSGSGSYSLLRGRITDGGEYRFKLEHKADGRLVGWVVRTTSSGAETRISPVVTASATYAPGTVVRQKLEVAGTSPTTLRAKVWLDGTQEPAGWTWEVTDGTSVLQGPGHTGVAVRLGSTATNTPVTVAVDDYLVTTTGELPDPGGPGDGEPGGGEPGGGEPRDDQPVDDVLGLDSFARTVAAGWGTSDHGGAWLPTGTTSVASGAGRFQLASSGALAGARLPGAEGVDLVTSASTAWDVRPAGSGGISLLRGRILDGGEYRFKLQFKADGRLSGWVVRTTSSGAETRISPVVALTARYGPDIEVRQKLSVTGTSPTTIRAKAWLDGQPEPKDWQWEVTDGAETLQGSGHTGIAVLLGSGVVNIPVTVQVRDYLVTPGGGDA